MNATRPVRRRRWLRRLVVLVLLLLGVLFLSPLLLRVPFVRNQAARGMSDALGRPVAIANASAFWGSGITLEGLVVESPPEFEEPLATVKRVHVDLDLLALLKGEVDASLEVDSPWITFQEDAEGRSNADGLFPEDAAAAEAAPSADAADAEASAGAFRLRVVVRDGLLRAQRSADAPAQEVRDLQAELELSSREGVTARIQALAVGAGVGGVDAPLELDARIPETGGAEGPIRLVVPELDLARLADLARGAAGVVDLRGRLAADVDATVGADGRLAGTVRVAVAGLGLSHEATGALGAGAVDLEGDLRTEGETAGGQLTLSARDLRLGPGPLSRGGYREPTIDVRLDARRLESGAIAMRVEGIESRLLRLGTRTGREPLRVEQDGEQMRVRGTAFVEVELPVLAEAFGAALELEPEDRLAGRIEADLAVDLTDADGEAELVLGGRGLVLPASWGGDDLPPTDLSGRAVLRRQAGATKIDVEDLRGFGLTAALAAEMDDAGLEKAHVELRGDLARARPLLAPALGLEGRAGATGRLEAKADVVPEADGQRLDATATIRDLRMTDATGRTTVREPEIGVTKRVFVSERDAAGTQRYRIEAFRLTAAGLVFDMQGTAVGTQRAGTAQDLSLDASAKLSGDAGRLAPTVARYLGPDYADLVGRGPITGDLVLRGPIAEGGARLLVQGKVQPGSWSAGGLTLDAPQLDLARPAVDAPLRVGVTSGVNQGTLAVDLRVMPGPAALPWTLDVDMKQVDTAPLLLDRGAGQYLTLLFPTLVPVGADTRVLSGKLDAKVALRAADLGGEAMAPSLQGEGEVSMADGAIGQSTLFKVAGSGGGLGDVGKVLTRVIPDIGKELESLSKALTFRTVESKFRIMNQIVRIDHGLLDGESVRVGLKGAVAFDERVNLEMPVMVKGKAAEELNRLIGSPALPLKVTGTLERPRIAPGIDASQLARGALGDLIPGGGDGNPLDRLRDLVK